MRRTQLGWLNLPHSPTLPPPVTAKLRVVNFQEISLIRNGIEGKTLRKGLGFETRVESVILILRVRHAGIMIKTKNAGDYVLGNVCV